MKHIYLLSTKHTKITVILSYSHYMYKLAARSNCSYKRVQVARLLPNSIVTFFPLKCTERPRENVPFPVIFYFAWEDQSDATYRILHTVLINCITVLYESYSTVMQLIGQIQYTWANTVQLCREFIQGMLHKQHTVNC